MLVMRDEQGRRFLVCCPGPHLPPVLLFSEPPYERWVRPGLPAPDEQSVEEVLAVTETPSAEQTEAFALDHPGVFPG